ncbi:MAG: hypothetical protein MJ237_03700 [bacterium]|nr:hypothetical protein [bacterium]
MKKYGLVIIFLIVACLMFTACKSRTGKQQTINYQRRLVKYLPAETKNTIGNIKKTIDLSEGLKLRYDAKLGPDDVNFDFRLNTKY